MIAYSRSAEESPGHVGPRVAVAASYHCLCGDRPVDLRWHLGVSRCLQPGDPMVWALGSWVLSLGLLALL